MSFIPIRGMFVIEKLLRRLISLAHSVLWLACKVHLLPSAVEKVPYPVRSKASHLKNERDGAHPCHFQSTNFHYSGNAGIRKKTQSVTKKENTVVTTSSD